MSVFGIATFSFTYVLLFPSHNNEFIFSFLLKICILTSFTFVVISASSCKRIFIEISTFAFIPIFLPFITLHSKFFIFGSISTIIPICNSGTTIVSEKSSVVFNPLKLFFSPSAKYIIYETIFPSNLNFPSKTSFLYIHIFPSVLIVFNISGFESGTIISP